MSTATRITRETDEVAGWYILDPQHACSRAPLAAQKQINFSDDDVTTLRVVKTVPLTIEDEAW